VVFFLSDFKKCQNPKSARVKRAASHVLPHGGVVAKVAKGAKGAKGAK
jgi:hypothetical protein